MFLLILLRSLQKNLNPKYYVIIIFVIIFDSKDEAVGGKSLKEAKEALSIYSIEHNNEITLHYIYH